MRYITADEQIKGAVREAYGTIARRFAEQSENSPATKQATASCCGPSPAVQASCCGPSQVVLEQSLTEQASCCGPEETAAAKFYSAEETAGLPDTVTEASLGCGNPTAIADLKPGETVLDLGSGGGIDCFLAARQVGPEGQVIGLDMTPDMIKLARRNAKKMGVTNVDFRFGEMEDIPLPDGSVDTIISNCVINLSPDKGAVFAEAFRVLRPGGRISVSDIVVDGALPQPIRDSLNAWAGCISGALDEDEYLTRIRTAGFEEVDVQSRDYADISEAEEWQVLDGTGITPQDLVRKVASIKVRAQKPA